MKKRIVGALALCLIEIGASAQTPVQAQLKEARIYQHASLLTYEVMLAEGSGRQKVRIHGLGAPQQGSELIWATGTQVRSRTWSVHTRLVPDAELERLEAKSDSSTKALEQLHHQLGLLVAQQNLLTASVAASPATSANLDVWNSRLTQILDRQRDLRVRIASIEARHAELEKLRAEREAKYPKKESVLELELEPRARGAKLELRVLDHSVNWSPSYTLKVDERGASELVLNADLYQGTGRDWSGVPTRLVTGYPGMDQAKPILEPWVLGYQPMVVENELDSAAISSNAKQIRSFANDDVKRSKSAVDEGVAMEFPLNEPLALRANVVDRVVLNANKLSANLTFYSAPRLHESVFALAEFPEWGKQTALAAPCQTYYRGQLVNEDDVPSSRDTDTLDVALGEDQRVRATFDTKVVSERKLASRLERHSCSIQLVNPRAEPITITVEDRSPVSRSSEIQVIDTDWAGAMRNEETGILTWTVTLAANETKSLNYGFTIKRSKK
jgi:uncharacterized protein (TIGR02231 family)